MSGTISSKEEIKENVDSKEIIHHSKLADDWWNTRGQMRALHSMNQIRVPFIRDGLISTGRVDSKYIKTGEVLKNLNILEVGCGGGILTEVSCLYNLKFLFKQFLVFFTAFSSNSRKHDWN